MAFMHGSKAKVYLNGFDISGYLNSFMIPRTIDTAETSTFGNLFKTHVPGLYSGTFTADGIYDGAVGAVDDVFNQALNSTADDIVTWSPQGDVFGSPAYGISAVSTSYQSSSPLNDVSKVSFVGTSDSAIARALVYHPLAAEGAGGNTGNIDNTLVSTPNGGVLTVQVVAGVSLLVKVQDSADGTTFTDLVSTVATSAQGAQYVAYAGVVRRYTRVLWTGTGTFSAVFARN